MCDEDAKGVEAIFKTDNANKNVGMSIVTGIALLAMWAAIAIVITTLVGAGLTSGFLFLCLILIGGVTTATVL